MKQVFKYELNTDDICKIIVPKNSVFLSVVKQNNWIVAYFLVDPNDTETREVNFRIAGTGHPINEEHCKYFVGTVVIENELIFHVFLIQ